MANNTQNVYKLRILSGSHSGADLTIEPGSYVLGKSEQADIILSDDELAPKHAVITLADGKFTLTPLAQPLSVGGTAIPLDQKAVEFQSLQRITLGSTCIALGSASEVWPALLPDSESVSTADASNPQGTSTHEQPATKRFQKLKLPFVNAQIKPRRLYPVGALAMLAVCVTVVVSTVDSKPVHRPLNDDIPLARVHRLISDLQLPPLEINANDDGIIEIKGHVELIGQKNRLQQAIRPLSPQVKATVFSDEEILMSASAVLRSLNLRTVRVKQVRAGKVHLEGYVEKQHDWQKAQRVLEKDISGIKKLVAVDVDTLDSRLQDLRRMIANRELASKLQIVVDQGSLTLLGTLTRDELSTWHDILHMYKERYGNQPKLVSRINDKPEIDLKLRGVSVGASPFIVTQAGGKYMEGSTLENGYVLKSIKPDRIILSRNNSETVYYFGDK